MIERVCVIGAGVIGSLFAAHLAAVAEVWVLTRRPRARARARRRGPRVTRPQRVHARVSRHRRPGRAAGRSTSAIVATKATGLDAAAARSPGRFPEATVMTVQNGLGAEQVVREHGDWPLVSAVTFMSGTRHADTHVEYILDTETWLGPYDGIPYEPRRGDRRPDRALGPRRREAFPDLRPAQWSKLIFNATVNAVAALTGLPHDAHFAAEEQPTDLGHLVHELDRRGQGGRRRGRGRAARGPVGDERARDAARQRALPVDARGRRRAPADRDRPDHRLARPRGGAARRARTAAHALYRLVKAKEESWLNRESKGRQE